VAPEGATPCIGDESMSTTRRRVLLALAALLLIFLAALLLEKQTHFIGRYISDRLYDSRDHYLSCSDLPTEADVRRTLQEHRDLITAIEQVHQEHAGVEVDATSCPGRADLVIWYASHQDRVAIEGLLAGDTFHGVPARLQNR